MKWKKNVVRILLEKKILLSLFLKAVIRTYNML